MSTTKNISNFPVGKKAISVFMSALIILSVFNIIQLAPAAKAEAAAPAFSSEPPLTGDILVVGKKDNIPVALGLTEDGVPVSEFTLKDGSGDTISSAPLSIHRTYPDNYYPYCTGYYPEVYVGLDDGKVISYNRNSSIKSIEQLANIPSALSGFTKKSSSCGSFTYYASGKNVYYRGQSTPALSLGNILPADFGDIQAMEIIYDNSREELLGFYVSDGLRIALVNTYGALLGMYNIPAAGILYKGSSTIFGSGLATVNDGALNFIEPSMTTEEFYTFVADAMSWINEVNYFKGANLAQWQGYDGAANLPAFPTVDNFKEQNGNFYEPGAQSINYLTAVEYQINQFYLFFINQDTGKSWTPLEFMDASFKGTAFECQDTSEKCFSNKYCTYGGCASEPNEQFGGLGNTRSFVYSSSVGNIPFITQRDWERIKGKIEVLKSSKLSRGLEGKRDWRAVREEGDSTSYSIINHDPYNPSYSSNLEQHAWNDWYGFSAAELSGQIPFPIDKDSSALVLKIPPIMLPGADFDVSLGGYTKEPLTCAMSLKYIGGAELDAAWSNGQGQQLYDAMLSGISIGKGNIDDYLSANGNSYFVLAQDSVLEDDWSWVFSGNYYTTSEWTGCSNKYYYDSGGFPGTKKWCEVCGNIDAGSSAYSVKDVLSDPAKDPCNLAYPNPNADYGVYDNVIRSNGWACEHSYITVSGNTYSCGLWGTSGGDCRIVANEIQQVIGEPEGCNPLLPYCNGYNECYYSPSFYPCLDDCETPCYSECAAGSYGDVGNCWQYCWSSCYEQCKDNCVCNPCDSVEYVYKGCSGGPRVTWFNQLEPNRAKKECKLTGNLALNVNANNWKYGNINPNDGLEAVKTVDISSFTGSNVYLQGITKGGGIPDKRNIYVPGNFEANGYDSGVSIASSYVNLELPFASYSTNYRDYIGPYGAGWKEIGVIVLKNPNAPSGQEEYLLSMPGGLNHKLKKVGTSSTEYATELVYEPDATGLPFKITRSATGDGSWVVVDNGGTKYTFDVADKKDGKVEKWHLRKVTDKYNNIAEYLYSADKNGNNYVNGIKDYLSGSAVDVALSDTDSGKKKIDSITYKDAGNNLLQKYIFEYKSINGILNLDKWHVEDGETRLPDTVYSYYADGAVSGAELSGKISKVTMIDGVSLAYEFGGDEHADQIQIDYGIDESTTGSPRYSAFIVSHDGQLMDFKESLGYSLYSSQSLILPNQGKKFYTFYTADDPAKEYGFINGFSSQDKGGNEVLGNWQNWRTDNINGQLTAVSFAGGQTLDGQITSYQAPQFHDGMFPKLIHNFGYAEMSDEFTTCVTYKNDAALNSNNILSVVESQKMYYGIVADCSNPGSAVQVDETALSNFNAKGDAQQTTGFCGAACPQSSKPIMAFDINNYGIIKSTTLKGKNGAGDTTVSIDKFRNNIIPEEASYNSLKLKREWSSGKLVKEILTDTATSKSSQFMFDSGLLSEATAYPGSTLNNPNVRSSLQYLDGLTYTTSEERYDDQTSTAKTGEILSGNRLIQEKSMAQKGQEEVINYKYDSSGRIIEVTGPYRTAGWNALLETPLLIVYDILSFVMGYQYKYEVEKTTFTYYDDALGRVRTRTDSDGTITEFLYGAGYALSVSQGIYTKEISGAGFVINEEGIVQADKSLRPMRRLKTAVSYETDAFVQKEYLINNEGVAIGPERITKTYYTGDKIETTDTIHGTTTSLYDSNGRLTEQSNGRASVGFEYYGDGKLKKMYDSTKTEYGGDYQMYYYTGESLKEVVAQNVFSDGYIFHTSTEFTYNSDNDLESQETHLTYKDANKLSSEIDETRKVIYDYNGGSLALDSVAVQKKKDGNYQTIAQTVLEPSEEPTEKARPIKLIRSLDGETVEPVRISLVMNAISGLGSIIEGEDGASQSILKIREDTQKNRETASTSRGSMVISSQINSNAFNFKVNGEGSKAEFNIIAYPEGKYMAAVSADKRYKVQFYFKEDGTIDKIEQFKDGVRQKVDVMKYYGASRLPQEDEYYTYEYYPDGLLKTISKKSDLFNVLSISYDYAGRVVEIAHQHLNHIGLRRGGGIYTVSTSRFMHGPFGKELELLMTEMGKRKILHTNGPGGLVLSESLPVSPTFRTKDKPPALADKPKLESKCSKTRWHLVSGYHADEDDDKDGLSNWNDPGCVGIYDSDESNLCIPAFPRIGHSIYFDNGDPGHEADQVRDDTVYSVFCTARLYDSEFFVDSQGMLQNSGAFIGKFTNDGWKVEAAFWEGMTDPLNRPTYSWVLLGIGSVAAVSAGTLASMGAFGVKAVAGFFLLAGIDEVARFGFVEGGVMSESTYHKIMIGITIATLGYIGGKRALARWAPSLSKKLLSNKYFSSLYRVKSIFPRGKDYASLTAEERLMLEQYRDYAVKTQMLHGGTSGEKQYLWDQVPEIKKMTDDLVDALKGFDEVQEISIYSSRAGLGGHPLSKRAKLPWVGSDVDLHIKLGPGISPVEAGGRLEEVLLKKGIINYPEFVPGTGAIGIEVKGGIQTVGPVRVDLYFTNEYLYETYLGRALDSTGRKYIDFPYYTPYSKLGNTGVRTIANAGRVVGVSNIKGWSQTILAGGR